jgi:hypothetical protein
VYHKNVMAINYFKKKMCVSIFTGLSKKVKYINEKKRIKKILDRFLWFEFGVLIDWTDFLNFFLQAMDRSVYHFEWRIEFHLQEKKGRMEVDISIYVHHQGLLRFCCATKKKKKLFIIIIII